MQNPDVHSRGFVAAPVVSQRYGLDDGGPDETPGLVQRFVPAGSRVLDVGCGNGHLSDLLRVNRGCQTVGIEPHPDRAAAAAARGLEVEQGLFTIDRADSLGATFDVVLFGDVLEHLADPLELLLLARRVLRPGGSVVISVPNVAHWQIRLALALGRFDYAPYGPMDATHLRWFTFKTLDGLLAAAGFAPTDRLVSAGLWLPVYATRTPWRRLSADRRNRIVRWCVRRYPRLFGCQLVFKATLGDLPQGDRPAGA